MWLSYPELPWDNFVARCKASHEFSFEVDKARNILNQLEKPGFRLQEFVEENVLGYHVDKRYKIYTPQEFMDKYGHHHSKLEPDIKQSILEVVNADGELETVIALDEGDGRTLTLRSTCGTKLQTSLLAGHENLRPAQGAF